MQKPLTISNFWSYTKLIFPSYNMVAASDGYLKPLQSHFDHKMCWRMRYFSSPDLFLFSVRPMLLLQHFKPGVLFRCRHFPKRGVLLILDMVLNAFNSFCQQPICHRQDMTSLCLISACTTLIFQINFQRWFKYILLQLQCWLSKDDLVL